MKIRLGSYFLTNPGYGFLCRLKRRLHQLNLPASSIRSFLLGLCMLFALSGQAQTTRTWFGAPNASWNVAANWTLAVVPSALDPVIIPAGATPQITANAVCASIQINNSPNNNGTTTLTINTGQTLIVGSGTGAVIIGNGGTDKGKCECKYHFINCKWKD